MGNCLTCFRSPTPMVQNSVNNSYNKEGTSTKFLFKHNFYFTFVLEMSEARLYSAPSHTVPVEPNNGNNKITITSGDQTNQSATSTLSRFYQRRSQIDKIENTINTNDVIQSVDQTDSRLIALFETYRDPLDDSILAEGIERLCNDLQVSPDEFKVLVFAWKLDAGQMCRFTRSEWINGLKAMKVDSLKGIQQRLPEIVTELENNNDLFKDLYRFTFRFGLDVVTGQRALPSDMAALLWKLVFSIKEPPILERWLIFLDAHRSQVRAIPRDTWNMFLNFAEAVGSDLSSYDDTEAWPSLFDDFVEYENDQANQNVTKTKETDNLLISHEN